MVKGKIRGCASELFDVASLICCAASAQLLAQPLAAKTNFFLPPVAETSKLPNVVQTARYSHFFKSSGLFSCAIVFLTTLQFFVPPTVEASRAQLHSSDSAYAAPVSDAILEEAREGEFRLAPDAVIVAGLPGILLLIALFLLPRQSAAADRHVIAQHTSRAPPASSH